MVAYMQRDILILTDYRGYIPQLLTDRESFDINKLDKEFSDRGCDTRVRKYSELNFEGEDYSDTLVLYASSQAPAYKRYIEDHLETLRAVGAQLVPNFSLFLAHEDKLLQSLLAESNSIPYPDTNHVGTLEEGEELLNKLEYPVVGKPARGFASEGVKKITGKSEALRFLNDNLQRDYDYQKGNIIKRIYRQLRYGKRYSQGVGRIIFQEFIPNVDHDWKILIYGETAFALKRYIKEGDFRASGSGKFTFEETPPDQVLDLALRTREELESPWLSIDIIDTGEKCYLVEFQAIHFGMYTYLKANNSYKLSDGKWSEDLKPEQSIESIMVDSVLSMID
jgi:glutathione synthase/RimK-type ligase-like ATP-grasp enzyme